jgi:hypothetical protein
MNRVHVEAPLNLWSYRGRRFGNSVGVIAALSGKFKQQVAAWVNWRSVDCSCFNRYEDRQCTDNVNSKSCSCNICWRGNAINITYAECVSVALVMQHAKRMRRITLLLVACLALPHFYALFHKRHDFRGGGGKLSNIKCVFWFSLQILLATFLILRIIQRDITISVHMSSCKLPIVIVRF